MRRELAHRVPILMALLVPLFLAAPSGAATPGNANQPQYLLFQIFTGGPEPKTGIFTSGNDKGFYEKVAKRMQKEVGQSSTASRKLGFAVGPIALDQSDAEVRRLIRDAFEIAEENDLAIALHLDDYMFWRGAKGPGGRDLVSDKANIEWQDWDGERSENLGIGWLKGQNKLAPQMCYEAEGIKKAIKARATLIGTEVSKGVASLKSAGKEDLFAAVIVGWESNLADGYCSLSKMGFSKTNPPKDFDREREQILQRNISRWAKWIALAGVPNEKLYTHIAPIPPAELKMLRAGRSADEIRKIPQSTIFDAYWTAFNSYSNPGFSAYPAPGLFDNIYAALAQHDNPRWANAEGTNVSLMEGAHTGGAAASGLDWETYLGRSFNHGAGVVVIFGGYQGMKSRFAETTESQEAVDAYRKFLRGETLVESATLAAPSTTAGGVDPSSFRARMQGLGDKLKAYHSRHGSSSEIRAKMQELDGFAKAGDMENASKVLDELEPMLSQ